MKNVYKSANIASAALLLMLSAVTATQAADETSRKLGSEHVANVTEYALDMNEHNKEFRHFFKMDPPAPNGCRWIFVPIDEKGGAVSFLVGQIRNKRVAFRPDSPSLQFEGQNACRTQQIRFGGF